MPPLYTTLQSARSYLTIKTTEDDQILADLIEDASQTIEDLCGYNFDCRIETHAFNGEVGMFNPGLDLRLWPLLEIDSVQNGNGDILTAAQYEALPKYAYPKEKVRLTVGNYWRSPGDPPTTTATALFTPMLDAAYAEDALVITGKWGFHRFYARAWLLSTITVGTGGIDASSTTLPITGSNLRASATVYRFPRIDVGHQIRIGTEYMAVVGPIADTYAATELEVQRGYNGSTAAAHDAGTAIYVWQVETAVECMVKETLAATYSSRQNAAGDTIEPQGAGKGVTVDVPRRVYQKIIWPYYNYYRGTK